MEEEDECGEHVMTRTRDKRTDGHRSRVNGKDDDDEDFVVEHEDEEDGDDDTYVEEEDEKGGRNAGAVDQDNPEESGPLRKRRPGQTNPDPTTDSIRNSVPKSTSHPTPTPKPKPKQKSTKPRSTKPKPKPKSAEVSERSTACPPQYPCPVLPQTNPIDWSAVQHMTTMQEATMTRRTHLEHLSSFVPMLQQLQHALREEAAYCEQIGDIVHARATIPQLRLVDERLRELEDYTDLNEFRTVTRGYINAYAMQQEIDQRRRSEERQPSQRIVPKAPASHQQSSDPSFHSSADGLGVGTGHMPPVRPSLMRQQCTGSTEQGSGAELVRTPSATPQQQTIERMADLTQQEVSSSGDALDNGIRAEHVMRMLVNGFSNAPVDLVDKSPEVCTLCNVPVLKDTREQMKVCPLCKSWSSYADDTTAAMLYPDESEKVHVKYFRGGHFSEHLTKATGREKLNVQKFGSGALDKLGHELVLMGYKDPKEITQVSIGIAAKKRGLKKCYEHVVTLASMFSGIPPTQLLPIQMVIVRVCYKALQRPFEELEESEGVHTFFQTKFVMYKICQLFRWEELFPLFPITQGTRKVKEVDALWKKHMDKLGWPFVPVY